MKKILIATALLAITGMASACPLINTDSVRSAEKGAYDVITYSSDMTDWAKKIEGELHAVNPKLKVELVKETSTAKTCGITRVG